LGSDIRAGDFIDGLILAAITRTLKPLILWELGTGYGRTGLIAAHNTPDNAKIFTIDCDGKGNCGRIFRDRPEAKKITVFNHDRPSVDFSPWRGKANLVFVDANHEYENVLRDTEVAFNLVAPGGWIIWHDVSIDTPGVPADTGTATANIR
jgi:predicted O-methyltransferase YrrM